MPEFVFLRAQIEFGMMAGAWPAGNSLNHANARALQLLYFVWIVRKQSQFANAESFERFRGKFVISRIRGESELPIRLHCVESRVLQLVRFQFINQADATAFLRQV